MEHSRFEELLIQYNIPKDEFLAMCINLYGIHIELPFHRIRTVLSVNGTSLLFSVENDKESPFLLSDKSLYLNSTPVYSVESVVEDTCEIVYTRNHGKVLCFNPFNRSSCNGCKFCYNPVQRDSSIVDENDIYQFLSNWILKNGYRSLSHLDQVAIVTGCIKEESAIVDYLCFLRGVLESFGFSKEILYFGMITQQDNLKRLSSIKPLRLCFTLECFNNREKLLRKNKRLSLEELKDLMINAKNNGIVTTFSYILGLDSLAEIESGMSFFKNCISDFPIISLFQTDDKRRSYRHPDAWSLDYYLRGRRLIEDIFLGSGMAPNNWSNYRSPWRTCFGKDNQVL